MQLMTVVLPQLEELAKKGGEEGRKKISQYTRWLTIVLATMQGTFMANAMEKYGVFYDHSIWYLLFAIIAMVAGTLFLMWLGEQISDKGIGNGVSLIIFIGIVPRFPTYVTQTLTSTTQGAESVLNIVLYIVVALIDDEEATLKRLRKRGASIALEAANPAYETRIFGPDRVRIQGKLVNLVRKY